MSRAGAARAGRGPRRLLGLLWLPWLLLMSLGLVACVDAPGEREGVAFIDVAQARLEPESGPPQQRSVRLRFRWDRAFPG